MTRQRAFHRIGRLAAFVLLVCWSWWCLREMNYVSFSRKPLPEAGQVVAHVTKGIVVYITANDVHFDLLLKRILIVTGVVLVICLAMSGELAKMLNPPKPPPAPEL